MIKYQGMKGTHVLFLYKRRLIVKTPNNIPLFSERMGYRKPLVKCLGYRIFWERCDVRLP